MWKPVPDLNGERTCGANVPSLRAGITDSVGLEWSHRRDLNPRPAVYKTAALPSELRWRVSCFILPHGPGLSRLP
jgi:hypothetical protein